MRKIPPLVAVYALLAAVAIFFLLLAPPPRPATVRVEVSDRDHQLRLDLLDCRKANAELRGALDIWIAEEGETP